MGHYWHMSGGAARFRGESAELHSARRSGRLRNCRKLKVFSAQPNVAYSRRVALLLLPTADGWRWTRRSPGTWCAPSREPRHLLQRTCASNASRCSCPVWPADSRVGRPTTPQRSRSSQAICSPVSRSRASIISRPGPRAWPTCFASARDCRRRSTTAWSSRCATGRVAARSSSHAYGCGPVTASRSATGHSQDFSQSSIDRVRRPVAFRSSSIFFGGRRGSIFPRPRSRRSRRDLIRAFARLDIGEPAAPREMEPFERWAEL